MAEAKKATTKKRRVVKDPETFRQRALKANSGEQKPKRAKKAAKATGGLLWKILGPVLRPLGRLLKLVFYRQPFKFIGKWLAKLLLLNYIANSWKELRQVTWPTFRQSVSLTFAVLVFSAVFLAIVWAVDWVLNKAMKEILLS